MTAYNDNRRWSGPWHIVGTVSRASLESWATEHQALYFCEAVNVHNAQHGHAERFEVEYRGPKDQPLIGATPCER